MSIEISGVQGYEYQYLVTIYLSLMYTDKEDICIFVENDEDAQIKFCNEGHQYILDIQAKKKADQSDLSDFCKWISHFEKRSDTNYLLSKIITDPNRYVVFVTDSRCKDDICSFIRNEGFVQESNQPYNNSFLDNVKGAILNSYRNSTSPIDIKRHNYLESHLPGISKPILRKAFKKISIIERSSYDQIKSCVLSILNMKYLIPQIDCENVYKELIDIVIMGRDTGADIALDINKLLTRRSKTIMQYDTNYIKRVEEQECFDHLVCNHTLLLAGAPFCGKSYLAKSIAQKFAERGYHVCITTELSGESGALNFLNYSAQEPRLLLYEDPFGAVEVKSNAHEILIQIYKLIDEKSSPGRKIIITSRTDVLLTIMCKETLDECKIKSNVWYDLTLKHISVAYELWDKCFGGSSESKNIFGEIQKWLKINEGGKFLELGEISHLKCEYPVLSEIQNKNIVQLINTARISTEAIISKIQLRGTEYIKLFIALGLCCNTIRTISIEDMEYILGDFIEYPAINTDRYTTHSVKFAGKSEHLEIRFPYYGHIYKITDQHREILDYFESSGYIARNQLNSIYFRHPIFYAASKSLFRHQVQNYWRKDDVILLAKRSLSALSKNANICALITLDETYEVQNSNDILDLISLAVDSIFPSVKDKAIFLLDKNYANLNFKLKERVLNHAINRYFGDHILWHNSEPWFNPSMEVDIDLHEVFGYRSPLTIEAIDKCLKDNEHFSTDIVYKILNSTISENLTEEFLLMAASYDEVFIKEKAVFLFFKNYAYNHDDVCEYLNDYEDCNIIFNLFRGSLISWLKYSQINQSMIQTYFKKSISNRMSVAARSRRFLEDFASDYNEESINWSYYNNEEKEKLWYVWGDIFSELFINFPLQFTSMHEPHMVNTIETSLKYIKDKKRIVRLMETWNEWLIRCCNADDYGMSVMEYLMIGTKDDSSVREELFNKMLNVRNTSIITSHINHIVNNWHYLSKNEANKVIGIIKSDRNDVMWIKAVALTRRNVPEIIQVALFDSVLFNKELTEIITLLREQKVLEECLNVYCGYPQPLWWNGYHHPRNNIWNDLIQEILRMDILDKSYDVALREYFEKLIMEREWCNRDLLDIIFSNGDKRKLSFERLFYITLTHTGSTPWLWGKFLEFCSDSEKKQYFDRIIEYIELIEYTELNYDFSFSRDIIINELYARLPNDTRIYRICETIRSLDTIRDKEKRELIDKSIETLYTSVVEIYKNSPPRMNLTDRIVLDTVNRIQSPILNSKEMLETNKDGFFKRARKLRDQLDENYILVDWNYQ
ncbi:MAG: hypothetical protein VB070_14810 [Clostridiaceae bacterium]|nr:hypothetical protein [Clostridiaceae bacterium]